QVDRPRGPPPWLAGRPPEGQPEHRGRLHRSRVGLPGRSGSGSGPGGPRSGGLVIHRVVDGLVGSRTAGTVTTGHDGRGEPETGSHPFGDDLDLRPTLTLVGLPAALLQPTGDHDPHAL